MDHQGEMSELRPILVTGAHRSGTTWVGRMLAASDHFGYISEPLNVWHRPGVMRTPVKHWYTYICEENEEKYRKAFQETIKFQYHTIQEIQSLRSLKDIMRMGRDWRAFSQGRKNRQRAVVKDPFAVFSSRWFFNHLGCSVVITVRHPAAFVSSLKRLNWPFEFSDLLKQPLLIRDLLSPFHKELEEMVVSPGDVIERSCLLWRLI
jgi:glutaredoxin-related protein